jgi:hypothetical protein
VRFFPPGWEARLYGRQGCTPASAKGTDLMTDSPATVEPKQLRNLHIELKVKQPTPI